MPGLRSNIFGGITQTDKVARGIIEAVNEADRLKSGEVPMVLRLRGTGEKEAQRLVCFITDRGAVDWA